MQGEEVWKARVGNKDRGQEVVEVETAEEIRVQETGKRWE